MNVKSTKLTDADMERICRYLIQDKGVIEKLGTLREYDGSFEVKGLARFRYNIFRFQGKMGIVLRIVPTVIPTIEMLGLPQVLRKIAEFQRGLVLVTGATGSGKSSTLAAMIDHINATAPVHILTIEDPIEFVHPAKRARLIQREVGKDTVGFVEALRAALRQDPDVVLVGEMRDAETIDIALKAAETGHLVLSTVHTTDAIKTIGRLVSVFPPEEQRMVRLRIADNLVATVSQRLLKRADGKGMVAAQEIMIVNGGIIECIADPARTGEMNDYISKSREISGAQTFEQHLVDLYQNGIVSLAEAKEASTNPADFERNLMYGSSAKTSASSSSIHDSVQLDMEEPSRTTIVTATGTSSSPVSTTKKAG